MLTTTMKRSVLILATALMATALFAQQTAVQPIFHERPDCMWSADEMFLAATVVSEGETRAYYRLKGAADWCYVVGDRLTDRSFFVLPEFSNGATVQYFFLSHVDDVVTGRSDQIYEVVVSEECTRRPARHEGIVISDCEESGGIGTAIGAALQVETKNTLVEASPFVPGQ